MFIGSRSEANSADALEMLFYTMLDNWSYAQFREDDWTNALRSEREAKKTLSMGFAGSFRRLKVNASEEDAVDHFLGCFYSIASKLGVDLTEPEIAPKPQDRGEP